MMTLLVHSLDSMHVCDMLYKLFHFGASGNLYQLCKPHSFIERLCSASTLDCTPLPYTWAACDVIYEQSQVWFHLCTCYPVNAIMCTFSQLRTPTEPYC